MLSQTPGTRELARVAELAPHERRALIRRETISAAELSILSSLLGRLGMTPADRARLSVPIEKPENKFASLAREAAKIRPN